MNRTRLSALAHSAHPIACPLGPEKVGRLVDQLALRPGATLVDLGCGPGAWLAAIAAHYPAVTAIGVDISADGLAAAEARLAGAGGRVRLVHGDAGDFRDPVDALLCMGSTHALGGVDGTLERAATLLRPGGVALVGEGFWTRPPTAEALAGLGASAEEFTDLAGLVDQAEAHGLAPLYVLVSDQDDWDDYEWNWTGSLERHAADHPDDPDRAEILEAAASHRRDYLHGYRGVLGFASLVLTPR